MLASDGSSQAACFLEPVREYVRLAQQLKAALKARANALGAHITATLALEQKQVKYGGANPAVEAAETEVEKTAVELARVTELVQSEVVRFRKVKRTFELRGHVSSIVAAALAAW